MATKHVLIAFADSSLGGTARSALTAGIAWHHAGFRVSFTPLRVPHPVRLAQLADIGEVVDVDSLAAITPPSLVHFHHGAWSARMRNEAKRLLCVAAAAGWHMPMLTNNVFAVDDRLLRRWPGPRITGTLGEWALAQYRLSRLPVRAPRMTIVPNAQDTAFFRAPTIAERQVARKTLGYAPNERVILRVGSPLPSKWSPSYLKLAERATDDTRLVMVGAPSQLSLSLRDSPHVSVHDQLGDDTLVRMHYWAADVFAHDSARGESFGNVITEALLSGLPVIYRARPFRDNTPWEWRDLSGFTYCENSREWLDRCLRQSEPANVDPQPLIARYSLEATSLLLGALAADPTAPTDRYRTTLGLPDYARVSLRHNWISTLVKDARLTRHQVPARSDEVDPHPPTRVIRPSR